MTGSKNHKPLSVLLILGAALLLYLPNQVWSQLVIGQYEDEAPMRTWNNVGIVTTPAVSMGETQFTLARDCSVSLTNPALLSRLPKFTIAVNGALNRASFFRYSLVNTGTLTSQENISVFAYALDYLGASYSFKGWTVGLNFAILEYYYRPGVHLEATYEGQIYHTLNFNQDGVLSTINFSLARKINDRFSFGLGVNFVSGWLEKTVDENFVFDDFILKDTIKHNFTGFYMNGGIVCDVTDKLTLGAMFRTPYTKKSDSESQRLFRSSLMTISSDSAAKNTYRQPLVLGIGVCYQFSKYFIVASDLTYFNWSNYEVLSFEEEIGRNFKNILKIGAGTEYWGSFRLFGKPVKAPLRIGFIYDPQPIKEPNVHYLYLTFGTGFHVGRFSVDLGAMLGKEYGSGDNLSTQKLVITVNYQY
jgi:long-subunit fatty acid transport protein